MKRICLFLTLFCPLCLPAKVFYLDSDGKLPDGRCSAVEARVSLSSARPGKAASWTLSWGTDSVIVEFDCRNMVDGVGEPSVRVRCGNYSSPASSMNFNGGWNSLAVEWGKSGGARILAGESQLEPVMEIENLSRPDSGQLSVSSPYGKLKVCDLIAETDDADLSGLMTDCDPYELEVWEYIDSTESSSALLGGNYKLGLQKTSDGYDLIYLDGARVNSSAWYPGMKKATLISRGFQNHFLLTWIDSTGRTIPGEHFAVLDPLDSVLTLTFPAFPITVRFTKRN